MAAEYFTTSNAALTVGLLSLLTGYIGADVAPPALIERMLWPQRSNNASSAGSLKNALFLGAGGPLYGTVLKALDNFFKHSLHKGAGRGHMLGTAFFPDTGIGYTMYPGDGQPAEQELVRNGLLVRILKCMPDLTSQLSAQDPARQMRQKITVSHLELFNFENIPPRGAITLDEEKVNTKTLFAVLASELPAIILSAFVALLWKPLAAGIFMIPLGLKILAALTTIQREDLMIPAEQDKKASEQTANSKFTLHIPGEGFQVISGPAELILPFFRHYGHPIRCRWREVTQMLIVAATGLCFPLTLATTILFMPVRVQILWVAYQAYMIFAMLAARYGGGELWGTTEERIGHALGKVERLGEHGMVVLKNRTGMVMGARVKRTLHGSYTDGKAKVMNIVQS